MKKILIGILAPLMIFSLTTAVSPAGLFIGVTSDKTVYKKGDPVTLALTVLNNESTVNKVNFSSGKKFDFSIYREDRLVWKWSGDKMFTTSLSTLALEPKIPLTFVITFNQNLPTGQQLESGRYKITGSLCTREKEYSSDPIEIEIK